LETLQKIAKALDVTLAVLLEQGGVKVKRGALPDRLDPALKEMITSFGKENVPINKAALDALYVLQEREGAPKTAEDWRWLYDTIVLNSIRKRNECRPEFGEATAVLWTHRSVKALMELALVGESHRRNPSALP